MIGSKSAPRSWPPKTTKKPTTPKKEATGKPMTRSATAQGKEKLAKEQAQQNEEEIKEENLLKVLNLSKSEAGTLSIKTSSTYEENKDAQLKEALRHNVYETRISQEGRAARFIASAEGVSYSEEDMATVRQILINFIQDPKAVLGLHQALEMLQEEHNKYYEDMEA